MELPTDMLAEIDRLGESRARIERLSKEEGLEFARFFLQEASKCAALFDKWFPQLQEFAEGARRANPIPVESDLSPTELAFRRILQPKIASAERVPQRNNYTAAIFTAPLVVLPLVIAEWPSTYRNRVFLTADEFKEWNRNYDEPKYSPWWYVYQYWEIEPNPPQDLLWLKRSQYTLPPHATSLLVSWGLCLDAIAGRGEGELWHLDQSGCETRTAHSWEEYF